MSSLRQTAPVPVPDTEDKKDEFKAPTAEQPKFSGAFVPHIVQDPVDATNPFTIPLANPDATKQVIGEAGSQLVYMPAQLRQYIPTLYKQVHLNTRALLSVNGFEVLDGTDQDVFNPEKGVNEKKPNNTVTSDIRNTLLRSTDSEGVDNPNFEKAVTQKLEPEEIGMSKLIVNEDYVAGGSLRRLECSTEIDTKFVVHDGQLFDTYYFTEKGDHLEYLQVMDEKQTQVRYIVKSYGGYFANSESGGRTEVPGNAELFIPDPSTGKSPWETQAKVLNADDSAAVDPSKE